MKLYEDTRTPEGSVITTKAERRALFRRIDELIASPTLVHLVDHYVERLMDLDARVSTTG